MPADTDPSSLVWYTDPDFVAARNHVIPPDGRSAYTESPPQGSKPEDITSFIYGQATWSRRHMPNILYRLHSGDEWDKFRRQAQMPAQKKDDQGQPKFEEWPSTPDKPQELLDFEILPDHIGSREHWWRLEAWRRLDPRIRWLDITMRIGVDDKPSVALLRSRVSRPRVHFSMLSWFEAPSAEHKTNDTVLKKLSLAQIQNNTTRGATPGLINPELGRAGGRIYLKKEGPEDDTSTESSSAGSPLHSPKEDAVEGEDVSSETGGNIDSEAGSDVGSKVGNDVVSEAGGDVASTAGDDIGPEAGVHVPIEEDIFRMPSASEDGGDVGSEIGGDVGPEAGVEVPMEWWGSIFDDEVIRVPTFEDFQLPDLEPNQDVERFDHFDPFNPNGLPLDSRDFDSNGELIVGDFEWQLEQAIRAREKSRRDDSQPSGQSTSILVDLTEELPAVENPGTRDATGMGSASPSPL